MIKYSQLNDSKLESNKTDSLIEKKIKSYSRTTAFLSQPKKAIQEQTIISTRKGQVEINNNHNAIEVDRNNASLNI